MAFIPCPQRALDSSYRHVSTTFKMKETDIDITYAEGRSADRLERETRFDRRGFGQLVRKTRAPFCLWGKCERVRISAELATRKSSA